MGFNNEENLRWQFDELVKTLIAMTLPAVEQRNVYGMGATADEMLNDFYSYYSLNKKRLLEQGLIDFESIKRLEEIDTLTDKWSNEKGEDFWFEMDKHDEWDRLRFKAKETLQTLNKAHLGIKVCHENIIDKNGRFIGQKTDIELVKK